MRACPFRDARSVKCLDADLSVAALSGSFQGSRWIRPSFLTLHGDGMKISNSMGVRGCWADIRSEFRVMRGKKDESKRANRTDETRNDQNEAEIKKARGIGTSVARFDRSSTSGRKSRRMKVDLEMLEAMVANGATGAMILAMIKLEVSRYEASRASRRDMEAASKRRKRRPAVESSGSVVDMSGHDVDNGGHQVDTSGQPFELFWKAYPKRSGSNPRAPAEKVFLGFVKAGVASADIIAGAKAHAIAEPEKVGTQFIPQAVKWLRDRRWEDYLSSATASPDKEIDWEQVLTSFTKFGHWSRFAGPHPDSPACKCPKEILEKHGILEAAE